ncbi:MAG: aminopeptidase [Ignavibacteria bacterium]|nr:aminopeptidase [Ignavibacteria bacterium]
MNKADLNKYCKLILEAGVNLYPEQCLVINCGIRNFDFALMLSEAAYAMGAKYVDIKTDSNFLTKYRIENNRNTEDLEYIPDYIVNRGYELLVKDFAFVTIDNLEEIDVLKGTDSDKLGSITKKAQESNKLVSKALGSSKNAWTIAAVPGPGWASKVFNSDKNPDKLTDDLWNKLVPVLRLDKKDPVAEWKKHGENLVKRSSILNEMKIDRLLFEGPGTELEIGINSNSLWRGGLVKAQNGRIFIPNLPTEEVFTTPDFKRTNGKVVVTKPVKVMENLLYGIWFEFKDGKVTDFGTDSGREILEKYFSTDEGASYLGEVALVDINSEVFKSGLIFNSILYDENAACHIALGRGFPMCFSNKDDLITPESMIKNGCNNSLVHTDFMIGSEKINVTGFDKGGSKTEIIKNGSFCI